MTYGEIVLAQFRKDRAAVVALWVLALLFLVATYAPAIALDVPFWTDLADAPASPWLHALFDPRVFPLEVDVFFNLLMGTLPAIFLAVLFARGAWRWRALGIGALVHLAVFLALLAMRAEWRSPYRDLPVEIHAAGAKAVWPPVRHHPSRRQSEFTLTRPFQRGQLQPGAAPPPEPLWPYYVLGADPLGNDVLTRMIYGTRISLTIGIIAAAIYVTIGVILGAMAGFLGGWVDDLLMFLAQVFLTIPALFLILFILSVVERPTIYHIMLVIGALGWPTVMRLVRGEFLRQREIDYVNAARALGFSNRRIMFRHIVPNSMGPVFVSATFGVASAVLVESTLSFLGLGDPSAPSWGQILQAGYENSSNGRHLIWIGGLAIFLTVLVLNLIGEGLRDALDPKLRK